MPRLKSTDAELAELGAAVKYAQLRKEMDELIRRFPGLKGARNAWRAVRRVRKTVRRRKRRLMSKAQRAAISARMKAMWASRRKKRNVA
jgi:hypothetical protein